VQGWMADLVGPRITVLLAGSFMFVTAASLLFLRGRLRLARLDDPHDVMEVTDHTHR